MKTTDKTNTEKRVYATPEMEKITLDNEISLALESMAPPAGPFEIVMNAENRQNPFDGTLNA